MKTRNFLKKLLVILGSLGTLFVILFGLSMYQQSHDKFHFKKNEILTEQSFKQSKEKNEQIYVLYKPTCPVCKENIGTIKTELSTLSKDTKIDVYYFDSTNDLPAWFVDEFKENMFNHVRIPYLIYVNKNGEKQSNKTAFTYGKRLDSRTAVKDIVKMIDSAHKSE